jgi:DNA-binding NarL/FixJ family response regulator
LRWREGSVSGETSAKTRILLADAHNMVRQGIRQILEREADFEVIGEADNGLAAVRLAHELKPDLIIIEVRMPKLNTVEAIRRVKAEHPEVTVLVLTSRDEEEYIVELLKAGAGGYLLKSAWGDELVQAIRFVRAGVFVCHPTVEQRLLKHAASPRQVALDFGQHLTRREAEVLKLAAKGLGNRDIAGYLGLAEGTVKGYFVNIFGKMRVGSRTEAVLEAIRRGWISAEEEQDEQTQRQR